MRSRQRAGRAPLSLRLAAAAGLLYLHVPMFFILLYAFTTDDKSYQFPPPGLTLHWFGVAWGRVDGDLLSEDHHQGPLELRGGFEPPVLGDRRA